MGINFASYPDGLIAVKSREKVELLSLKALSSSLFLSLFLFSPPQTGWVKLGQENLSFLAKCEAPIGFLDYTLSPYPSTMDFHPLTCCHMSTSVPLELSLFDFLTSWHVAQCETLNTCHVSHVTLGVSKNMKFRLSSNSTKFDVVAKFH